VNLSFNNHLNKKKPGSQNETGFFRRKERRDKAILLMHNMCQEKYKNISKAFSG